MCYTISRPPGGEKKLKTVVLILQILVALALIASVLLQSGRSAGVSGAIAGGAESIFGKKKGLDEFLAKVSAGLAAAFMLFTLLLSIV
ncbi:MAG TPA: preprotein translocase subunit SecG [Peptococcaceae bacterium]|nr:preprotein translocase subunit SecG [Peptococcaceae bacterium]